MFNESVQYLRSSTDPVKTILIGGLLLILSPLLLPVFTVTGYILEVIRRTSSGNDEPPAFEAWVDTTVDGAKASVIVFVYLVLPALILTIAAAIAAVSVLSASSLPPRLATLSGVVGFGVVVLVGLFGVVIALAGMYISPAAIAHYADTGRIRDGFAIRTLWPALVDRTYAMGWLTAAALIIAGGIVSGLVGAIPVAGFIAAAFVSFYAVVAAYYVIGHTWADVRPETTMQDGHTPTEQPAV
ncbi:DUF4013 domain-containing protein [Halalkalirubrum salinum]|uniref:DUF4013 domain-containing protein n=1 Tax=Halalkalirubrum salinum TaxID=2563889 RepID=UPI0010FB7798|nr:DUF4013 domain-containing protein [Halalkalirubrum salinum]